MPLQVVTSAQGRWVRAAVHSRRWGILRACGDPVLVVDDEPAIRLLCRVNLELDGYEVLEASSLATAREELEREDVDVVLLDVHLCHERSDALVAECHARRPPIPVVLVTGSVEIRTRA